MPKGKNSHKTSMKDFRNSIRAAGRGFLFATHNERNFRIELYVALGVLFLIFFLKVISLHAVILLLMIMWVLTMELTNTVVERVVDILKPRIHPYARVIKDIMAAVVLLSSITAVVVGVLILIPYIFSLL